MNKKSKKIKDLLRKNHAIPFSTECLADITREKFLIGLFDEPFQTFKQLETLENRGQHQKGVILGVNELLSKLNSFHEDVVNIINLATDKAEYLVYTDITECILLGIIVNKESNITKVKKYDEKMLRMGLRDSSMWLESDRS